MKRRMHWLIIIGVFFSLLFSTVTVGATVKDDGGTWLWPVDATKMVVSTGAGFDDPKYRGHKAIDIPATYGTKIQATRAGTVYSVQHWNGSRTQELGNWVVVKHKGSDGNTYYSHYCHLSSISVKKGQSLNAGDKIGIMGDTGKADGVHLHFQITRNSSDHYGVGKSMSSPVINNNINKINYVLCKNHNYDAKTGKCKSCSKEYIDSDSNVLNKSVATSYSKKNYYKIKTATYLKSYPLSTANNKSSAKLSAGRYVCVLGTITSSGDTWYKIKHGSTSEEIGYVPASVIEKYTPSKASSTISINNTKSEYTSKHGVNTNFAATTSSHYPIRSITMKVGTKSWSKTFNELYLSKGLVLQTWTHMDLSGFGAGTYNYTFTVEDITGASEKVTGKIVIYDSDVKVPTVTVKDVSGGKTVTIKNNAGGGTTYYSLNGGANQTKTATSFNISLAKKGSTKIKTFVIKNGKRSNNVTKTVTVSQLDVPTINIDQVGRTGSVTFKSPDSKATIKYKIGDASYKAYDGSVVDVEDGVTISAYAERNGYIKSEVVTAETEFAEPKAPVVKLVNEDSKIAAGKTATVGWEKDKRAVSYTASLYDADGVLVDEKTTTETTASFTLETAGEYYVEATAENDIGKSEASERITLTAVEPLTVVFKNGYEEDAEVLSELKVNYGEKIEQIPAPSKKGHTFEGWENTATNVVSLNAYTKSAVKENAEYVATYSKNTYKIKLYDTDGSLLETQSVKYEESADTEGVQVTLKEGYAFAGWHVSWTADGNSFADYTKVDSDMDVRAVASWADKELPVIVKVTSAEQTEDGKYINVDIDMTTSGEEDLSMYLVAALKAKDTTTGVEKTVYADRKIIYLDAGETTAKTTTMKMKADAKGLSSIEVTAMQCNEDLSTGSAYSKTVSEPITISKHWGEWSEWTEVQPEEAEIRDIESKTQYRISNKIYTYSGYDTLSGYTKESTETISTTYGGWTTNKPSAATSTTNANKTVTTVESTSAYRWFAYYCDCKKVCWKNSGGSCKYCGGKTDNTLIVYSNNIPTKYDSDGAYHFPETITASTNGNYRLVFWNGKSADSFTTKASTEVTYLWKSSTFSRTIYRTKTVKTRSKFSSWDDWSDWGDTEYATTSTRKVETRAVYRYRDLDVETSGSVVLDPEGKYTRNFKGNINVGEDLNGKVATIMVYQANNSDPNKYQMQYLGQTQIGEGNGYNFSFIPKQEPTVDTGNYIVSLGVQGSTGLITVGLVEAPVKNHTVTLYYKDAQGARHDIGQAQTVKNHGDVELSSITVPEQSGYYFVGWSQRTTNITESSDIEAIYVPVQNAIVFVDWINENLSMSKALTGESIELPGVLEDAKGYKFIGWKLEDGTIVDPEETASIEVAGDMVITAEFEPIQYTVKFMGIDGTVIDTQLVKYGEAAEPPTYEPEAGTFIGWDTDADWWSVEEDTDVYPIIIYDETALKPESKLIVDEETDEISLELTTEEENGGIYYTTDGTVPTAEKIAEYINADENEYVGSVEKYTAPLKFEEDTSITAVTYVAGKTESDMLYTTYEPEPENLDSIPYNEEGWQELGTYNMKVQAGKDITVEVDMKESTGLTGYDFLVACDDEVFYVDRDEYDEPVCENGEAFKEGVLTTTNTEEGVRMQWVTEESNESTGQLFKLTMHAEELAEEGRYPVTVCYAPENTLNADYDEVSADQLKVSVKSQASIDITTYDIAFARDSYIYEGAAIEPAVNISGLKEGEDYTVSYENNINVGTAKAVITGTGGYEGVVEKEFSITTANIANADVDGLKSIEHTGSAIIPEITVTYNGILLEKGKDYEVAYDNNVNIGTANVTISGTGNFGGKNELTFEITKTAEQELSEMKTIISQLQAKIEELKALLTGSQKEAQRVDLIRANISSISNVTYTGKAIEPAVNVTHKGKTLVENTDYIVEYANNTSVGIATVTLTGIGNYKESVTRTFAIVPNAPITATAKLSTASGGYDDITFSWSIVTGASGYSVYYKTASANSYTYLTRTTATSYTKKNLSDGVRYYFKVVPYYQNDGQYYESLSYKTADTYTLKKISTPKVSKSGSKVKVKWTNISGETGYQISKSSSKSKTSIVSTYKTTSGTYKTVSATKGKTYYYKVRAYVVVDGANVYGPWSSVKAYKR